MAVLFLGPNLQRHDDMERPRPLKDDFCYVNFLRRGTMPHRRHQGSQEAEDRREEKALARAFIGVSTGKARQGRVNSFKLASLNNPGGLWTIGVVSRFLVPGPWCVRGG